VSEANNKVRRAKIKKMRVQTTASAVIEIALLPLSRFLFFLCLPSIINPSSYHAARHRYSIVAAAVVDLHDGRHVVA
jgi:hypothetical protein